MLRSSFAGLFLLIGTLLIFPASFAAWEQRVLLDREQFIETGNKVLEQDAVQAALSKHIGEEAVAESDVRPAAAEITAAGIVRNLPGSPVADAALRTAYELLHVIVRGENLEAGEDVIVLDISPVVEDVRLALGLPPDAPLAERVGRIVLVEDNELSDAFRIVRWFDDWAWLIAALPLIAYAGAIAVSPRRTTTLALAGALIAATALLFIVLAKSTLSSQLTEEIVSDPTTRAAANATYDVIAGTLVSQEYLIMAAGGVLLVAGILGRLLLSRNEY